MSSPINDVWRNEAEKFIAAIGNVRIPSRTLEDVEVVIPKRNSDLDVIPQRGGCYWIWTNEPVNHSLHKNETPDSFEGGEVIYNGIAQDNVRGRVKHHLFGQADARWSGISLDIYSGKTDSHRKKALSEKGKVPYIKSNKILKKGNKLKGTVKGSEIKILVPIRVKKDFLKINLSNEEKKLIEESLASENIYFRNGIDISEEKHRDYEFRVYYLTDIPDLYMDFIEKKWRKENKLPKLCSYSTGR